MTKDSIQKKARELADSNNNVILEWATGTGKTFASLQIINNIISKNKNAFGYLICKENTHLKNWMQEIDKQGMNDLLPNMESFLYASLKKRIKVADFIIFDECHALTDSRVREANRLIGKDTKLIFLSATIQQSKRCLVYSLCRVPPEVYKITLMDAINAKLLPQPEIFLHEIELNDEIGYSFIMKKGKHLACPEVSVNYEERFLALSKSANAKLKVNCNAKQYYEYLSMRMTYLDEEIRNSQMNYKKKLMLKNSLLNTATQRKRFIAEFKTKKSQEILNSFRKEKSRFVCFSGSVNQSLALGASNSVNSKNTKEHNQQLVDDFNDKKSNELLAVNMLREGLNLSEVRKGLIIQLDSEIGTYLQMMGRLLRHKFPEIHLIKLLGTKDQDYFNKSMAQIDDKFITIR